MRLPRTILLGVFLLGFAGYAAAVQAADQCNFSIQAAQASERGKNADNPQMAPALAVYSTQLKGLGYGKYEDLGKSKASAKAGQTTEVAVAGFTVSVQVVKVEADGATITATIKDGGKERGQNSVKLKAGSPALMEVGSPGHPVILVFQSE